MAANTSGHTVPVVKALYFPPYAINPRSLAIFIHQARQVGINALVLHLKDPRGKIFWKSRIPGVRQSAPPRVITDLKGTISYLKANGIRTIAKLDVFADHALVAGQPDLGITDSRSGLPWQDKNGLFWANPYEKKVWQYNIRLAAELATAGFDEIQFDYVRFPSDGDLNRIAYNPVQGKDRSRCIASFLETAYARLHPLGVQVSAAVFGLTAWKKHDFGIGQVVEKMTPHLDVICPMFYPSHFPSGFLGKQNPARYPRLIMEASTRRMRQRSPIPVRPWIQDFWYGPDQVKAQIEGLHAAGARGWQAWNPSGKYRATFSMLAARLGIVLSRPKLYPDLADLHSLPDKLVLAAAKPVNLTSYRRGYSIISLQPAGNHSIIKAATPVQLLMTMDEGILDKILSKRGIHFGPRTTKLVKANLAARLLCMDLGTDSRRMQPRPIYICWNQDCRFTFQIPPAAAKAFRGRAPVVARSLPVPGRPARPYLLMD